MTSISKQVEKILKKIKLFRFRRGNIGASPNQVSPENVMELKTLIETQGGSVVLGDVNTSGDFVGRDKTEIKIEGGFNYIASPSQSIELIDREIEERLDLLRKARFFPKFELKRTTQKLARDLKEGELSIGSDTLRSRALTWCARLLYKHDEAEELVDLAMTLGTGHEIKIAEAFIQSRKGNKKSALATLAIINTSMSRSAGLMVVSHHEGPRGAIDWLNSAGFEAADLDSDGTLFLIIWHLELENWGEANLCIELLTEKDFGETPFLHHIVAITHLANTVPNELRNNLLNQPPFAVVDIPLASDTDSINLRRIARCHFNEAARVAKQLNCTDFEKIAGEYSIWLELSDPEEHDIGRQKLKKKLRDPKSALHLVFVALKFGIPLDLNVVEREIEQQIALHGGITSDAVVARFALALTQKAPKDAASYITQHRDELVKFFENRFLLSFQIEMYSRARMPEMANECLDILIEDGLSSDEEKKQLAIIAEAEGVNPVKARREQYERTDSLLDLERLIESLSANGDWDGIYKYGKLLFERTRSRSDAELFANALNNAQKDEQLVEFLNENCTIVEQSKNLQMLYCWSLYNTGALLEARSELKKLREYQDDKNYRLLQLNLGISLGDWASLSGFIDNDIRNKDQRSAQELLGSAQLALTLGLPHTKDLLLAAVDRGNDDAVILVTAYFLASKAGWDDIECFEWFQKAIELSGDDGPIQKKTLREILDQKQEWDRKESETFRMLSRCEVPMFLAARIVNKNLINMMLFPAFTNLNENDPRRRGVIPAYSGSRHPIELESSGSVGIDATTLLTLSFLKLLDKVFDAFSSIYLPHSTLAWLFTEKQEVAFHQPSRFRNAQKVRDLLATNDLEKLIPSTLSNSDLSAQVGDDLALLITDVTQF